MLSGIPQVSDEFVFQQDSAPACKLRDSSILQGYVAMSLKCDEIFNDSFICKFPGECTSKNFENWSELNLAKI